MLELTKRQRFCLFHVEPTTGTNYVALRMAWGSAKGKRRGQRCYPFKTDNLQGLRDKAALLMRHRLDQGFQRRQAVVASQTQAELIETMPEEPAPILLEAWRLAEAMPDQTIKKRYRSSAAYICQACDRLQTGGSTVIIWLRKATGTEPAVTLICQSCCQA